MTAHRLSLVVAGILVLGACGSDRTPRTATSDTAVSADQLMVRDIELGNAVTDDHRVTIPMTSFAPEDSIFVSVVTDGTPASATLAAVWAYHQGDERTRIDSASRTIAPRGTTATAFFVSRPAGWPMGTYSVEVFADGKSVGSRDFEVK